jgi:DNA polymerase III epsilon subunit-like protein
MSIEKWGVDFRSRFGGLPTDYLVFDTETTGLSVRRDLPVQIGHVLVRDRQVVNKGSFILNWVKHSDVDRGWLESKLERLQKIFADKGLVYQVSMSDLLTRGQDPLKVLQFYHEFFKENVVAGAHFVGHNILHYDCPLLESVLQGFCKIAWRFPRDVTLDTCAIARAIECQADPSGKLIDYQSKMMTERRYKVKSSADFCLERYDLVKAHNLDTAKLHEAEYDCYVNHLVFERQREIIDGTYALPLLDLTKS